jgi:hypothetical protein
MPSSFSPNLRIELPADGEQAGTWGQTVNTNMEDVLEQAMAGYTTVTTVSASQALTIANGTVDQARSMALELNTSTGAAYAVYAPPVSKFYVLYNASGTYTVTVYNSTVAGNTTAAGAGVAIPAGERALVVSNGTDMRYVGKIAVSTNTPNTEVLRDVSGNFAANVITASLTGNVTGNVTGNLTGNVTGNVTGNLTGNVTGLVSYSNTASGAVSTNTQGAIDQLFLREQMVDNPNQEVLAFNNGSSSVLIITYPRVVAAGDIVADRWRAGVSGATMASASTITSGTVVQKFIDGGLGTFVTGRTYTFFWEGTAEMRIDSGAYNSSPFTYTFVGGEVHMEFRRGTNGVYAGARAYQGTTDWGVVPNNLRGPRSQPTYLARFAEAVTVARQFGADTAGDAEVNTLSVVPKVVDAASCTVTTLATVSSSNVTTFTTSMVSSSQLQATVVSTSSGACQTVRKVLVDTGY